MYPCKVKNIVASIMTVFPNKSFYSIYAVVARIWLGCH